jgi:hypothetical protein
VPLLESSRHLQLDQGQLARRVAGNLGHVQCPSRSGSGPVPGRGRSKHARPFVRTALPFRNSCRRRTTHGTRFQIARLRRAPPPRVPTRRPTRRLPPIVSVGPFATSLPWVTPPRTVPLPDEAKLSRFRPRPVF